jgi:Immunity protein 52
MIDWMYLGAYWGPCPESLEECTDRLLTSISKLAKVDASLGTWFEKGASLKEALNAPVSITHEGLRDLLFDGQNRGDDEARSVIADLGYHVGFWNGEEVGTGLSVTCGGWSPWTSNSIVIELPDVDGRDPGTLYQATTILEMTRIVAHGWSPTWGTCTSHELREEQQSQPGEVVVGWATYLSAERADRSGKLPDSPTDIPLDTVMAVREGLGLALLPDTQ